MRRISLAVALIGAVAAAGCGGGAKPSSNAAAPGTAGVNFDVQVNNQGPGTVTSSPAGINCAPSTTCTATFTSGTTVVLTATASGSNYFNGWFGGCQGTGTCELSGDADKYVVAYFSATPEVHPNFNSPLVHGPEYKKSPQVLACEECHGENAGPGDDYSKNLGLGLAPACSSCHGTAIPTAPPPPTGGVTGVVTGFKGAVVAGAKVYLVPTGDVLADSIYSPPEWKAGSYASGALVSHHEGIYQATAATSVEPPADLSVRDSVGAWKFIAVVHTPHAFSNRNSYKAGDLVLFANKVPSTTWAVNKAYAAGQEVVVGATYPKNVYKAVVAGTSATTGTGPTGTTGDIADGTVTWNYVGQVADATHDVNGASINTVYAVHEALIDMRGSADAAGTFWNTRTTNATIDPPAGALTGNSAWEYVGDPRALAFFDNLPAYAAKTYAKGALVRDGDSVYVATATAATCVSASRGEAGGCSFVSVGTLKNLAVASNVDEPLEGTIREHGYAFATTDANGVYSFTAAQLPVTWTGKYYLTVVPTGAAHLPGGDQCKKPLAVAAAGTVANVRLTTAPSAAAAYVGPSKCLTCHAKVHNGKTLHSLGIRKIFSQGALQDPSRFPDWYTVTQSKFTPGDATTGGTTLYFYGVNGTFDGWKASETNPGSGVSFTARMYSNGGKYYVQLVNVKNPDPAAAGDVVSGKSYEVELSYGGGLYKQRFVTKVKADGTPGGAADQVSRFILPIQFNYEGAANGAESAIGDGRWQWQHYNGKDWFTDSATATSAKFKVIPTANPHKSFDSMCAGCHFTGYTLDVTTNRAAGVNDPKGEYDYNGDGQLDVMNVTCEACHGPGSEHTAGAFGAPGIVNPAKLTPERSVAICSQCHTRFVGQGGTRTTANALATEAPLDANHKMPVPGISRKQFLQNHVSKIDDGMWDAVKGNGKYSVKHHQQASDFLTTAKVRNQGVPLGGYSVKAGKEGLMTCASCHDLHGDSGVARQLVAPLDVGSAAGTTAGLCVTCHSKNLGGTGHTDRGSATPYSVGTGNHTAVTSWTCASCHVPKTAKSGSGAVAGTVAGETFYRGDISSHLFIGVPYVYYAAPAKMPTSAQTVAPGAGGKVDIMPTPMTNSCAGSCHTAPRATAWKQGIQ